MLARFERWRPWILGLHLVSAALLAGGTLFVMSFLRWMARPAQPTATWLGFFVGIVLGAWLGAAALYIGHGLALTLVGPRNDRLLIEYHDELQSLRGRR
jgi:hypothetical protein